MRSNAAVPPTDLIITHTDPDGFACAALIADRLSARGRAYQVWFADYPGVGERVVAAVESSADEIYVADLSLRERELSDDDLRALCRAAPVHLFDHHRLEPRRRALLRELCATCVHEEGLRCAAALVLEHFDITEVQHRALATAAQGADYEETVSPEVLRLALRLDGAIRPESGLERRRIVELLANGPRQPWQRDLALVGPLAAAADRVGELRAAARRDLQPTLHVADGPRGPVTVACAFAPTVLYLKEGGRALKERCPEAAAVVVFYASTAVVALPRSDTDEAAVPLLPFLVARGGGGRNNAGGFNYDSPTTSDNYPGRRDALIAALRHHLAAGSAPQL